MTSTSRFNGPVGPLRHRCPLCPFGPPRGTQLQRSFCRCQAMRYCSREHAFEHWPQHDPFCHECDKEYRTRWGWLTGDDLSAYWRSFRGWLAQRMLFIGTLDSVSEALDQMIRHPMDDRWIRTALAVTMLRMDRDQECYDFIWYWATCDPDRTQDIVTLHQSAFNNYGANVFENPCSFPSEHTVLSDRVALLLLKLKILVDVRNLKLARQALAQSRLPPELRDQIELELVRSPLSAKLQRDLTVSLAEVEAKLETHARQLIEAIHKSNETFLFNLLNSQHALSVYMIKDFSPGGWDESAHVVQYSHAAWWQTEGALDLLEYLAGGLGVACAECSVENEIWTRAADREGEGLLRSGEPFRWGTEV
ncbi:hypothetical protein F5Y14DRAFT_407306 [Nemania sp. NC0429]|nr:hypothetical protein F5Y14DRAFT_407306 [Nemania sp. NC0429]